MAYQRGLIAAASILVALTGCSDDDGDSGPSATETVTETVTASAVAEPSSSPTRSSPPAAAVAALGVTQDLDFGTVQVIDYRAGVLADDPSLKGLGYDRFDAIDVKTCVASDYAGEPIKLSWFPWALADAEGGTYPFLDVTGPTFIPPVYPESGERTTRPGQCSRGWIVFGTAEGVEVTEAAYENDFVDQPLVWSLAP